MRAAWMIAAALAARASATSFAHSWDWRETTTPHFRVYHQSVWLPQGLTMGLEHVNFRLRMDLGSFSNWSSKDPVNVYLYQDLRSYVAGEFAPPSWSNGIALYDKNAVAVPAMKGTPAMLRVLAHENTHLVFVNYFRQEHRDPPSWVNEGLAMLEEADSPERPETSAWYQNMVETDPRRWIPLEKFFALSPTKDLGDDKNLVSLFYVQAYSLTHFLVRKHSRLQFKAFCDQLRGGGSEAEALRLAYGYRSVGDFEKKWRSWLADPSHRRKVAMLPLALRADGDSVIDQAGRGSAFQGFAPGFQNDGR